MEGWGEGYESKSHPASIVPPVDDLTQWKDQTRAGSLKLSTE